MNVPLHPHWIVKRCISATLCSIALFAVEHVDARGLQDVRVSKTSTRSTIEIELGCAMRYTNYGSVLAGAQVRIQLVTGQDCLTALRGIWNELRRPSAGRLAGLNEIALDRGNNDQATITLHFDKAVDVEVRQTGNHYMLTVVVDTNKPSPAQQSSQSLMVEQSGARPEVEPSGINRGPGRQVRRADPGRRNRFVIRVAVLSESDTAGFDELKQIDAAVVYTNEVTVGERHWAELRLGFFDTEAEAQQALTRLGSRFASAWITVANPEEQERA